MYLLPLHASLDRHDALAVVVLALTLALGSFLASLRRRMRRAASADARRSDSATGGEVP
jgi:hypothetical protein